MDAIQTLQVIRGLHLSNFLDQFGLKPSILLAGFAGGVIRALSRKRSTVYERLASPVCGALAAGYLTTPLVHYLDSMNFPLPPDDGMGVAMNAAAFLVGISAMWLSDVLLAWFSIKLGVKPKEG